MQGLTRCHGVPPTIMNTDLNLTSQRVSYLPRNFKMFKFPTCSWPKLSIILSFPASPCSYSSMIFKFSTCSWPLPEYSWRYRIISSLPSCCTCLCHSCRAPTWNKNWRIEGIPMVRFNWIYVKYRTTLYRDFMETGSNIHLLLFTKYHPEEKILDNLFMRKEWSKTNIFFLENKTRGLKRGPSERQEIWDIQSLIQAVSSKQIDSEIINIIVILIYFCNQAHRLRDLVKLKFQLLYI